MTDDERRLLGALNDTLFLLGQALRVGPAMETGTLPSIPPLPFPSRGVTVTPDTKLSDLIGDLRHASPE